MQDEPCKSRKAIDVRAETLEPGQCVARIAESRRADCQCPSVYRRASSRPKQSTYEVTYYGGSLSIGLAPMVQGTQRRRRMHGATIGAALGYQMGIVGPVLKLRELRAHSLVQQLIMCRI